MQHKDSDGGAVDFRCDSNTYEGHKGTDIAVKDYTANIAVISPIDGKVMGVRNFMADEMLQTQADKAKVKGKECGNGLVLQNQQYELQLCHLKKGSVNVRVGDKVKVGDKIGVVGLSGKTFFPHLHFSIKDMNITLWYQGMHCCTAVAHQFECTMPYQKHTRNI